MALAISSPRVVTLMSLLCYTFLFAAVLLGILLLFLNINWQEGIANVAHFNRIADFSYFLIALLDIHETLKLLSLPSFEHHEIEIGLPNVTAL